MLKYIKHHLETITGIEIYPLISFGIFFIFFIGMMIWVVGLSKKTIHEAKHIPIQ